MLRITLICMVLLHLGCSQPTAQFESSNYKLVWSDDFSGNTIDSSKWITRHKDKMHGKSRIRKSCTTLDGKGHAIVKTQLLPNESEVGYEIESGMIATQGLESWKYGLFEARIKFESHPGHHGAFWLQSPVYGKVKDNFTASGTEMDVIEYFGNRSLSQNVHWNAYGSKDKRAVGSGNLKHDVLETVDTEFHVYSLLWTPEINIFYIDGEETWRTDKAVSHHDEYIILSLLANKWEAVKVKPENFPDKMSVDWVRVFQK